MYRIETRTSVGTWVPSNYFRQVAYETLYECLAAIAACKELWPCGSFRVVETTPELLAALQSIAEQCEPENAPDDPMARCAVYASRLNRIFNTARTALSR